jgi:hypothetical protein
MNKNVVTIYPKVPVYPKVLYNVAIVIFFFSGYVERKIVFSGYFQGKGKVNTTNNIVDIFDYIERKPSK